MEVQVVSRKFIKPSIPTPKHLRNLKLSYLDQLAPAVYGTFTFFYPANGNKTISDAKDERLRRLETSLSEILTVYYPLAGTYEDESNSIDCNDQGAEYLEARVHCQLNQFLQGKPEAAEINRLIPFKDEVSSFSPTMLKVQVNVFECGGLGINVNVSHKLADALVVIEFVQAWATASRVSTIEVASPYFGLGSLLPARDKERFKIPVPVNNEAKMVTKRFVFDGAAIAALKAKAKSHQYYSGLDRHPSRVEVVTALIWKARIAAAQAKHGHLRPSLLTTAINLRGKKTGMKLPEMSMGNVIKLVLARFSPTDHGTELNFPDLVSAVGNAIRSTVADCERVENAEDLTLLVDSSLEEIHESLKNNDTNVCVFSSLCRFPFYEIDFGWGKPAWVSSVAKPSELVLLLDTKSAGGIEAWVTLEEQEMRQIQQDQDIVAYTSNFETTS